MIGTRGVPARYGGFETAIEEIGPRLVRLGHEVSVFCRRVAGQPRPASHCGMRLVWLPAAPRRSLETLSHTALSVFSRGLTGVDAAIVFNAANAPLLPVIRARGIPVATHVDGLEWKRAKWGPIGRRYYIVAERLAVRWSGALIADAQGIADHYAQKFHAGTYQIAYGAPILQNLGHDRLRDFGLAPHEYHLVVARFEPENHVKEIIQGYVASRARKPLIVVGSAPYADAYITAVRSGADERVRFLGSVWDQDLLDQLYANSLSYVHGHSVGGTNPSLLRAAGAGAPVIAWDVIFNREVIQDDGEFFSSPQHLSALVEKAEAEPAAAIHRGARLQSAIRRYDWDDVANKYAGLCSDLADGSASKRLQERRPRVLVAAPAAELYGSDRMLIESVRGLVAVGADVTVTTPTNGALVDEVRSLGAKVVHLACPVLRKSSLRPSGMLRLVADFLRTTPDLVRAVRQYGQDAVYVNTVTIPSWLLAARLGRSRTVCHVHEAEASAAAWIRRTLYLPLVLAQEVLVNSRFSQRVIEASLGPLAPRTRLIYNGVSGPHGLTPARDLLAEPVRILFIGRLSPRKGPDVAIDAIQILRRRGIHANLTLLGGVFDGYEWFEAELRRKAESDDLAGSITFAGFDPDIWPYFERADIVTVPSTVDEPFGNTAVETALACRPLIVSDTSGLREAAASFDAAIRCPPGDPLAVADAVEKMIVNWEQFRSAALVDRDTARQRHSTSAYRSAVAASCLQL